MGFLFNLDRLPSIENNRAYAFIFRAVAEEKTLGIPLTIQLLDCWVRQWLLRKGFETNEDIEELIKLVGSLADGLFVLLCCLPKRYGVGPVRFHKKRVVRESKYSKELLRAVRKLQLEKVRKNFNYSGLDEDDHDKVPDIAPSNISQKILGQPTYDKGGQNGSDDEQEDDPDVSNDELASMMEISLDTTDNPQINIAEIHDSDTYQRLREIGTKGGRRAGAAYRAMLTRKLYDGGLYTLRKQSKRNQYCVTVLHLYIHIPTWIDLDHDREATVKAKLADRGSKHSATERLATSDAATATAQRLAISVTVFTKKGSTVTFWAKQSGMKAAAVIHDLVAQLEDVQAEQATQLS